MGSNPVGAPDGIKFELLISLLLRNIPKPYLDVLNSKELERYSGVCSIMVSVIIDVGSCNLVDTILVSETACFFILWLVNLNCLYFNFYLYN